MSDLDFAAELLFGLQDQEGFIVQAIEPVRKGNNGGGQDCEGEKNAPNQLSSQIRHVTHITVYADENANGGAVQIQCRHV